MRADSGEGGAQARRRSGGDPPRQRAGRQSEVRSGRTRAGERAHATSAFVKEALDRGAELFRWDERKAQGGKRQGSKVRGYGVATSAFVAGSTGVRRLVRDQARRPACTIQSGIGNLGTESMSDCHRVSAEMVGIPWEKVDITWGHTGKNLPWSCVSGGSQTTHAHTRAAHAAAHRRDQEAAGDRGEGARRQARAVHASPTSASPAPAAA